MEVAVGAQHLKVGELADGEGEQDAEDRTDAEVPDAGIRCWRGGPWATWLSGATATTTIATTTTGAAATSGTPS